MGSAEVERHLEEVDTKRGYQGKKEISLVIHSITKKMILNKDITKIITDTEIINIMYCNVSFRNILVSGFSFFVGLGFFLKKSGILDNYGILFAMLQTAYTSYIL